MQILGVDIGGSGIKGAVVDSVTGELTSERIRIPTPQPATPQAVSETVAEISRQLKWNGLIGCGFPAAIQQGVARTAANIDDSWLNCNVQDTLQKATGLPCYVANDADVAGLAEMRFGAGKNYQGTVFMVTIGTGLGTALFVNGQLVPNTELGHLLDHKGREWEHRASDFARKNDDLSWDKWAERFNQYLTHLEQLFWPDVFILGGGASKKFDKFADAISVNAPVVTAESLNQAGIIGAAVFAQLAQKSVDMTQLPS
ncbi:polyphosphate--glucose phosphotransferase [Echinimonas agarilytica]|uniref:ROK family protein n=1 Tax=Echinimonas agarilytica TaxID=1215918 RepID=A0AA41W425_9GAMM|nr:ROK family protein [Echinimonas agarilytica]MCM2678456.1 ROK family protein [Echinimonas agarilytica]